MTSPDRNTVTYRLGHIAARRHNGDLVGTGDVLDIDVTGNGAVHQPHVAIVGGDMHQRSAWVKRVVDALATSNDMGSVMFAFINRGTRNDHAHGVGEYTAGTFELWRDQMLPTGTATERAQMVTWLVRVLNGRADLLAQSRREAGKDYASIAQRNSEMDNAASPVIYVVVDSGDSSHGLENPEHVQLGNYYDDISEDDVYAKIHRHGAALGVFLIRTLPDTTAHKARACGYDVVIDLGDAADEPRATVVWVTDDDGRETAEYLFDGPADTADTTDTADTADTADAETATPATGEQRGQED